MPAFINQFRILAIVVVVFTFALASFAQDPAKWRIDGVEKGKTYASGDEIDAALLATVEDGWHLYALEQPEGGPIATTVKVAEGSPFVLRSDVTTPEPITEYDPNFQIDTSYFKDSARFELPLKASADATVTDLAIDVRYQLCNDRLCLPPKTVRVTLDGSEVVGGRRLTGSTDTPKEIVRFGEGEDDGSLWAFVWLAVTFGALSLLTPCVFPMIPITVSYFMKHSDGNHGKTIKLATVYSVGIIATFSVLGMLLALFLGAAGINLFAANPWVNILIAAVFIFFAFNLFGFYEISIPTSVLTKLDNLTRTEEGKGSAYIGALLMGLTFTLTSFTCTSPFIGTLLVSTSQGSWTMPLLGMLAFSSVFALPFFVLALVPRFLHSLPKSGGWLNSVKVVMGFLEIAAAMKFVSNVDLVWGSDGSGALNYGFIFSREIVLIIWVIIGLTIAAYILGLFKFRYDSPVKKITPLRIIFAGLFLIVSGYLALGVFGQKLGELESFLPPKNAQSAFNVLGDRENELVWIKNDLEGALQKARLENKRVFVDFTGYTCTNCRWMEANMFPRPEVKAELERFILVSLYTDGDGEIYQRQQQFQEQTFKTVALPFYAVFDAQGNPLTTFPGLTRDPAEFVDFLRQSQ
ncbi:MAG: thioredoxin family protein [Acidobacteriota bacterium]|nr:MAG: thioredoxin family protein [Acidobacteriota bacterium]